MKVIIKNMLYRFGRVTFNHVQYELNKLDKEVYGEESIILDDMNLLLWEGMSEELAETIRELHSKYQLFYIPCDELVYRIEGNVPSVEPARASKIPVDGYKHLHWLPVLLSVKR